MYRDINSNLDVNESIRPAVLSADADGQAVDLLGSDSCLIVVSVGAVTGTMTTTTVTLEESDVSGSGYTDVADADILGTEPTLTANTAFQFGYRGAKRYVRATFTVGAATNAAVSATVIRGNLARSPSEAPRSNALA